MTPADSHNLMMREIDEQPAILNRAAPELTSMADFLRPSKDGAIWIGGCGDSLFAAQALALHYRLSGWQMRPTSAAEMLWDADIKQGDTVVGISMSGSTRRTVEAISASSEKGAKTIAVTLNAQSALAQASGSVMLLPFTPISRAIPHGLDYHMTLLALSSLAGPSGAPAPGSTLAANASREVERVNIIAQSLPTNARFFFLGAGAALGSANYGAAKMHEAGGIEAWAFESENFTHGAQFLIRAGDHIVLLGAGGASDSRTADLKAGFAKLGASVSIAALDATDASSAAHLSALHCQALCLAVSQARGLNVTDPADGSGADAVQSEWFAWSAV